MSREDGSTACAGRKNFPTQIRAFVVSQREQSESCCDRSHEKNTWEVIFPPLRVRNDAVFQRYYAWKKRGLSAIKICSVDYLTLTHVPTAIIASDHEGSYFNPAASAVREPHFFVDIINYGPMLTNSLFIVVRCNEEK